jgi:hypothetical protein
MSIESVRGAGSFAVEFMTTAEVAELCRTSPESVRWWRHVGTGPKSFRVGRRVLYDTKEVRGWLEQLQRNELPRHGSGPSSPKAPGQRNR